MAGHFAVPVEEEAGPARGRFLSIANGYQHANGRRRARWRGWRCAGVWGLWKLEAAAVQSAAARKKEEERPKATKGSGCWSEATLQQTRGRSWVISAWGALPPFPWPKSLDEQSWSCVLYSKRGVEQLSPWGFVRGPWDSQGWGSRAVHHHTGK